MPAQLSFNRVAVLSDIFQKPKNNLYDTVFECVNRLWANDTQTIYSLSITRRVRLIRSLKFDIISENFP